MEKVCVSLVLNIPCITGNRRPVRGQGGGYHPGSTSTGSPAFYNFQIQSNTAISKVDVGEHKKKETVCK